MKTTINLPNSKINALLKATGKHTKTAAVEEAVNTYLQSKRIEDILSLAGKGEDFMTAKELKKMREQE